jgi:hypothetical protein
MSNKKKNKNKNTNNIKIERMNKKYDKLNDYLLGGNDKLIGSIIGFKRYLVKTNFDKWIELRNKKKNNIGGDDYKLELNYLPEGFAILLYFDHRTGVIERHLYNPNLTFFGKKPLVNDYTRNIIQSKSTTYVNPYVFNYNPDVLFTPTLASMISNKIKRDDYTAFYQLYSEMEKFRDRPLIEIDAKEFKHHPDFIKEDMQSLKYLFDGKLSRFMFNLFILDLTRDYIINLNKNIEMNKSTSYIDKITDMKILRENKENNPIKFVILDYPSNETLKEIYIPKHLFSREINDLFIKQLNIKLVPVLMKDNPQIIKDLKSMINSRTVMNNTKLSHLINKFNRIIIDRCINLRSSIKKK